MTRIWRSTPPSRDTAAIPVDAEQAARHGIVDVPAQLLEGHVGGFGGDEQDRVAGDVDPVDLRLENAFGKIAANLRDGVRGHR